MSEPAGLKEMGRSRLDFLRAEARYRRERMQLYAARLRSGGRGSAARLAELTREAEAAEARLQRPVSRDEITGTRKERRDGQAESF